MQFLVPCMLFRQNLGKTSPYNPLILGNRLQPTKNASKSHAVSIALMVTTVALMVNSCKWQNIWNAACHRPSLAKLEMKAVQPFLKLMILVWILFNTPNHKKPTNSLKKKPGPPMKVLSVLIFAFRKACPKIFRSQSSQTFLPIWKMQASQNFHFHQNLLRDSRVELQPSIPVIQWTV